MSVCCLVFVPLCRWTGDFGSKSELLILARRIFFLSTVKFFLSYFFFFLQTSLLCIWDRKQEEGLWLRLLALVKGDRLPVTGDRWQVTGDRWQVTGDRWQVTGETQHMPTEEKKIMLKSFGFFSICATKFSFSHRRDYKNKYLYYVVCCFLCPCVVASFPYCAFVHYFLVCLFILAVCDCCLLVSLCGSSRPDCLMAPRSYQSLSDFVLCQTI